MVFYYAALFTTIFSMISGFFYVVKFSNLLSPLRTSSFFALSNDLEVNLTFFTFPLPDFPRSTSVILK